MAVKQANRVIRLHGPGFSLIHRSVKLKGDQQTALAECDYFGNEQLSLKDHFPEYPVFPGVLLIEAMAQTAMQAAQDLDIPDGYTVMLAGIERARFRSPITPPATICLKATITRFRNGVGWADCQATVKEHDQVAGEATIVFSLVPKK